VININSLCDIINCRCVININSLCDIINSRCGININSLCDIINSLCYIINSRCVININSLCDIINSLCDIINSLCDIINCLCDIINSRCVISIILINGYLIENAICKEPHSVVKLWTAAPSCQTPPPILIPSILLDQPKPFMSTFNTHFMSFCHSLYPLKLEYHCKLTFSYIIA